MAIGAAPYACFLLGLPQAQYNLLGGNIAVTLAGSTYVPSMSTHTYLSDVTNLIGAAVPVTLTGVTLTYDATNFLVTADANQVVWQSAVWTCRWGIVYQNSGAAASSRLIGYIDFETERTYENEDMTLSFSSGFVQLPAS